MPRKRMGAPRDPVSGQLIGSILDKGGKPIDSHVERIAGSIGLSVNAVKAELPSIISAERWLWLNYSRFDWVPSKVVEELRSIDSQCCKLLCKFGIENPSDAPDGPQLEAIKRAYAIVATEDEVRAALEAVARLSGWAEEAVAHLAPPATENDVDPRTRAAVRGVGPGHTDDQALVAWISQLAPIYRRLTDREPSASWNRKTEMATNFTAFVAACAVPLGMRTRSDVAWKNLIQRIKSSESQERSEP